ncbi:hypothetical protein CDV55_101536 [Aspergillus turcosus]|uniref:Thiolase C-terminal domain-containing protein n=1 Tax=Aspergillus turcosus TaxID=1245748 RepID=A0A229WZU0_9EURO|nr:hypothetical protein CDV55_101536 [Aspergillus turcosus]RLL94747.1 hypothetical protein CFD26_104266 [Aspergillus turcosus]
MSTHSCVKSILRLQKLQSLEVTQDNVCELHNCFSTNQLILLDAREFVVPKTVHELVCRGDITYGGKGLVISPSGGLFRKPLGATWLAQWAELTWQLRGWANNRRFGGNCHAALQHKLGLGGAVVVTVYQPADAKTNERVSDDGSPSCRDTRRHSRESVLGQDTVGKLEARI